ncbi:ead/Ea22-like family protein [Enterobacter roggenkampii]|uniref:ead/Ea22-like family protein n=1 Tax=Enterobacter roggenkampii TaxID=1812935 RepID=UPI003CF63E6B
MSNIDKRALREAAEKAITDNHTQDEWFHYLRCSTPATVLALLDELEAAKQDAAKWFKAFEKAVSVGARYEERIEELTGKLEAAEKRIAELSGEFFALPPLNDDLIAILGRPNFTCTHLAELLRKNGQNIRRKAEYEQAAVIYWFLDLYLKYGDKWESIAKDDIQARAAMITAAAGKGE